MKSMHVKFYEQSGFCVGYNGPGSIHNESKQRSLRLHWKVSWGEVCGYKFVTSKRDIKTSKTEARTNLKDLRTIHVSYRIESHCRTEK